MMRSFASLAIGVVALAAPAIGRVPDNETFIDEDDEQVKEVEGLLNEVLLVDESGRVVMREEVRGMLPPEAMGRAEAMLGALVKVDETSGKLVFKDPNMVRPYLPMIKGFLDQGGLERLRELQKLPPEERREALRKMMEEQQGGGGGGGNMPNPFQRPPAPAPAPKKAEPAPPPPAPTPPPPAPRATTPERGSSLDERLARIERALERIEGQLERQSRSGGGGGEGESARPRRRGLLERLFGGRDGEGRSERMQFGRRTRVLMRGMAKLGELMQPEDMDRLRRAAEKMTQNITPEDLQDQGRLMQKAQESLDPEDMARFMEIFSDFLGTEEGREFVAELESSVKRLEELMNSERGEDLQRALEGLGGNGGEKLGERLRDLIQGRDKDKKEPSERHQGGRSDPRPHAEPEKLPQGPRPGSRPY